ncbi:MAG: pantoate--beta-alanine ligase [candidate division Zixibacteria bacterium]|nr:pantoate--beta-alanine ligase [candidate division Zixibacteria bacterium]
MKTVKSIKSMQKIAAGHKCGGQRIAFVPTMGALHDGHLALIRRAKKLGDVTVVSIFVNPAQFGPNEDFSKYPRNYRNDRKRLRDLKVDYIFYPDKDDMYPPDYETYVNLEKMSRVLEGEFRPIHFQGVATIVTRLFNIVQPDIAVFGQKDYQQSVIIKKMVRDLNLPVKIVVGKTVREKSGLALSSRNKYFDTEQKERAAVLYKSLMHAKDMIRNGQRNASKVKRSMRLMIDKIPGTKVDYIAITDDERLEPLKKLSGKFTISLAVWLDEVRLIDNISVSLGDER